MAAKTYRLTTPLTFTADDMTQGVYYASQGMDAAENGDDPALPGKIISENGRRRWMPNLLFSPKYTEVV